MTDYRRKENRREAFIRWYYWSLKYNDCDPAIWMANYIFKRYEFNIEQRFWLCWLYGNTYYYPTAFILWNEFPDFDLASETRIENWNNQNYKRLRYQTDTKYNKGHLPAMFKSYKSIIGGSQQSDFFNALLVGNEFQSFDTLYSFVKNNFHKFGRYTAWFYLQSLKYCCNLPIQPGNLLLNDYSGSRSHRNGLLFALGEEDKVDAKLDASEYDILEGKASEIISEMIERFPDVAAQVEPFTMETCLCSFKKLFRESNGRYLKYYLDRQAEEIKTVEKDGWFGIDWKPLWDARNETVDARLLETDSIDKSMYTSFLQSGSISRLEYCFNDESKVYSGIESFYE